MPKHCMSVNINWVIWKEHQFEIIADGIIWKTFEDLKKSMKVVEQFDQGRH